MKRLTERQIDKVIQAAELIDSGQRHWSCTTVSKLAGDKARQKYAGFYDQHATLWPGLGSGDMSGKKIAKEKAHRVMLLLFFAEAKGEL